MSSEVEQAYIQSAIPNKEVSDKILAMIDAYDRGSSGTASKYTKLFTELDWIGPSAGEFTLYVPYSFHGITNPKAVCYEYTGSDFEQVIIPTKVNNNSDIIITIKETLDAKFIGKIVID